MVGQEGGGLTGSQTLSNAISQLLTKALITVFPEEPSSGPAGELLAGKVYKAAILVRVRHLLFRASDPERNGQQD